ncbi:hypothetical protein TorRG33x02_261750 [Trema orientale]|uniref:Uncharacterized protein n=1 Tax=Trema orientale TaxID=63057 RepID=A0A2P5D5J9_TREOI|nr:hypothetical protein TorRG33x02_261750 [Trema orientale]
MWLIFRPDLKREGAEWFVLAETFEFVAETAKDSERNLSSLNKLHCNLMSQGSRRRTQLKIEKSALNSGCK